MPNQEITMKKIIALILMSASITAIAQVSVNGYVRKDGTYVAPHMRSNPDGVMSNNYSTQGNINPYTGRAGTVANHQSAYDAQMEQLAQQQAQIRQQNEQRHQMQQQQQLMQQQRQSGYASPGCNPSYPATCSGNRF